MKKLSNTAADLKMKHCLQKSVYSVQPISKTVNGLSNFLSLNMLLFCLRPATLLTLSDMRFFKLQQLPHRNFCYRAAVMFKPGQ